MTTTQQRQWQVGDQIHGFANGFFGRDSYGCRIVEHVGDDYLVTRNKRGEVATISLADADRIENPDSRAYCEGVWDDDEPDDRCTVVEDVAAWRAGTGTTEGR